MPRLRRLARLADGYAIAAGLEHGRYLRFAQALSDEAHARTVSLVTPGGDENLRLLRSGKVPLALAQGDAALDACEGKGSLFTDGPYAALARHRQSLPGNPSMCARADGPLAVSVWPPWTANRHRRAGLGIDHDGVVGA